MKTISLQVSTCKNCPLATVHNGYDGIHIFCSQLNQTVYDENDGLELGEGYDGIDSRCPFPDAIIEDTIDNICDKCYGTGKDEHNEDSYCQECEGQGTKE